jgi:hypothetical protein
MHHQKETLGALGQARDRLPDGFGKVELIVIQQRYNAPRIGVLRYRRQ